MVGKEGEDLSRHDKWLCMMYPRLKLLQRLLAEDGAIFISIDDTETCQSESLFATKFLEVIALCQIFHGKELTLLVMTLKGLVMPLNIL